MGSTVSGLFSRCSQLLLSSLLWLGSRPSSPHAYFGTNVRARRTRTRSEVSPVSLCMCRLTYCTQCSAEPSSGQHAAESGFASPVSQVRNKVPPKPSKAKTRNNLPALRIYPVLDDLEDDVPGKPLVTNGANIGSQVAGPRSVQNADATRQLCRVCLQICVVLYLTCNPEGSTDGADRRARTEQTSARECRRLLSERRSCTRRQQATSIRGRKTRRCAP